MPDYHSQSCHENLKHVAASRIDVVSSVVSLHYIQDAYITVISFERVGDLRTMLGLRWHGFRGALRFDKYVICNDDGRARRNWFKYKLHITERLRKG